MAKTECVNYNHGKDRCNLLMELVCEQKCRCSFFCTYEQQEASMKNHDRILRNKPEDICCTTAAGSHGILDLKEDKTAWK